MRALFRADLWVKTTEEMSVGDSECGFPVCQTFCLKPAEEINIAVYTFFILLVDISTM